MSPEANEEMVLLCCKSDKKQQERQRTYRKAERKNMFKAEIWKERNTEGFSEERRGEDILQLVLDFNMKSQVETHWGWGNKTQISLWVFWGLDDLSAGNWFEKSARKRTRKKSFTVLEDEKQCGWDLSYLRKAVTTVTQAQTDQPTYNSLQIQAVQQNPIQTNRCLY